MIFPVMRGWIAQKYSMVPAAGNVCVVEGEVGDFYFGVFGKSRRGREHEHGGKCRDLHVEAGHVSDQLASVPSVMARGLSPTRTETLVMPSTEEDRLREAGGACSVEGHIAFDLLHDLIDMAVEHSHRA